MSDKDRSFRIVHSMNADEILHYAYLNGTHVINLNIDRYEMFKLFDKVYQDAYNKGRNEGYKKGYNDATNASEQPSNFLSKIISKLKGVD